MLKRTNIYLPSQTLQLIKRKAQEERLTMAEVIRRILEKEISASREDAVESLLSMAKRAGKSNLKDVAKKHDDYLYGKPKHLR